jgi:transposase
VARRRVGKYPEAFRRIALERMKTCASVTALAKELGVDRTLLYRWQRNMDPGEEGRGSTDSPVRKLRKEVPDLKRVLAEKTLEVDFFKGALQKIEARHQSGSGSGGTASMTRFGR